MKKPQLFAFATLALVAFGCTSILGDFEVSPTASSSGTAEGGTEGGACTTNCTPEGCNAGQKKCGDTCVDTQTSSTHCGDCNRACPQGLTCGGGNCQCPDQGAYCDGQCFPKTDKTHCGPTCVACTGTQVCDGQCVDPPPPEFDKVPRSSTGWKDATNTPLTVTIKPTGQPGTKYECRSGPIAAFGVGTGPAWANCDGASGDTPMHKPTMDNATPEGTYVTEYRYKLGAHTSPAIKTRYYVHHSLDGVASCPRQGVPIDGPHFPDQAYFDIAKAFSTANTATFPTNNAFPGGPGEQRSDPVYLGNPWIKIPFQRISHTVAMNSSNGFDDDPWPPANSNYLFNERSLRHKWVMSADKTMILVQRQYIHPKTNDCKQLFEVGNPTEKNAGPPGRGVRKLECEGYVLNSQGNAICLMPNPSKPGEPMAVPFDNRVPGTAGAQITPLFNTYANQAYIYTPAPGGVPTTGTNPVVAGGFIMIPDTSPYGRWYKVASVGGSTINLTEPYDQTLVNQKVRVAQPTVAAAAYVIPTGFAKLHQDAHAWATGKKRIPAVTGTQITAPRPSWRTKCETPGCNSGKPWLTFLPP